MQKSFTLFYFVILSRLFVKGYSRSNFDLTVFTIFWYLVLSVSRYVCEKLLATILILLEQKRVVSVGRILKFCSEVVITGPVKGVRY